MIGFGLVEMGGMYDEETFLSEGGGLRGFLSLSWGVLSRRGDCERVIRAPSVPRSFSCKFFRHKIVVKGNKLVWSM